MKEAYIALLDSGIGGISVLAFAKNILPRENFIYFADIKNAPYGDKSTKEVASLVLKNVEYLNSFPLKALLLACNTATSASVHILRKNLKIPVLGMEPALKPAIEDKKNQKAIIVMATDLTIKERKFCLLMDSLRKENGDRQIIPLACSGLMELIENDPLAQNTEEYLQNILAPYQNIMGGIVLGCTHYVFLKNILQRLYPNLSIYDGNLGVSNNLLRILGKHHLLVDQKEDQKEILWLSSLEKENEKQIFNQKCLKYYDIAEKIFKDGIVL
ncbi:MAG: glutamate racemase [Clostridiales bacterium]